MKPILALFVMILLFSDTTNAMEFNEEIKIRQHLVQVALAREEADLIIRGATVLNVHTSRWIEKQDIVIKGTRIAWTGDSGTWHGKAAEIHDATGFWAVPGFGEPHKHIESTYLTPEYEAALVIPMGNTWTAEGSHEISNVVGSYNAEYWLKAERAGSPLKIFVSIGSATPPTVYEKGGGYYGYEEMADFLKSDLRVTALGEVMDWAALSNPGAPGHQRLWEMIQATYDYRGVIEGHGKGLTDVNDINAFAAAGLSSDHDADSKEAGWNKLLRGTFLQLRADEVRIVYPYLVEKGLSDWSNVSVTSDDRDVHMTLQLGSMDYNIRNAIESGVPVIAAYQMGSYNTARHFHIEHLVGSLAPGRFADVVLLTDPETVKIERVFANGKLAGEKGKYLLPIPAVDYPDWLSNTMKLPRSLTAEDFVIAAPAGRESVNAALLEVFYFAPDFIREVMPVTNGVVKADPSRGINKVALVDRHQNTGRVAKMFWRDVGLITPRSALAASHAHDLHNIWALGNDDEAMALAVNTVAKMGGGWALVDKGKLVAQVRLEIAGLVTQRPVKEVAAEVEALNAAADTMKWIGHPGIPELMKFAFLTASPWKWQFVAPNDENPDGFVNVTTGETHPVVW